ncbi:MULTISPECIES: prenyltransferase [Desulfococcus]|uniref:UbiA prenyltransferase n=1 Tax=Desulfococcus multivorans DSM 2059 TaxID=1121405 RepID=S7U0U9_DESML|nr:prenyltransferase [Desulfococcus multivorans]AOY60391.1 UbiA domain protein [Desulfococcus multivorans]EPR43061.1 UbiA prenyltransferase [Desulfococcus multivorans DSM 2059]SJZ60476.1 1,4-dihydroxy-2-naphthoate octaprenyltransferase [Desulfococcus multivorans DSM 2059]
MQPKTSLFSVWMAQIRLNFLLLAVFLVAVGLAAAYRRTAGTAAEFDFFHAILIMIGTVLAHISVNLFNEHADFTTRIDFDTVWTPFSGGTKMMVSGNTTPRAVMLAAVTTLASALGIGCYFAVVSHWSILIVALTGALSIVLYTPLFQRMMVGEFFAGLTLGSLVVVGTYIAMTARPGTALAQVLPPGVLLISVPPGILTFLLLLINEFPDIEADRKGGRRHLVTRFGRQKAAYIYAIGLGLTFATITALPFLGAASKWILLALIPLPLAFDTGFTAIRHHGDRNRIVHAMGKNVLIVLGTDLLMAVGILI